MSKAGILILTLLLVVAMFSGCRNRMPDTTNTTGTTGSTQTTTKATTPSTIPSTKPSTGVTPDTTGVMPLPTDGTTMTRGHRGPRY